MVQGITLKETHHGNPGPMIVLRAGVGVTPEPAANLPDDTPIRWWVVSVKGSPPESLKNLIDRVGVGLYADDVRITTP